MGLTASIRLGSARSRLQDVRRRFDQGTITADQAHREVSAIRADIADDLTSVSADRRTQIISTLGQLIDHLTPPAPVVVTAAPPPTVVAPVVAPAAPALQRLYADDGENHDFTSRREVLYTAGVNAGGYLAPLTAGAAARTAALTTATTYVRGQFPSAGGGDFGNTVRGSIAGIVENAYDAGYNIADHDVLEALTGFVGAWNSKISSTVVGVHADHLDQSRGMGFSNYDTMRY
jgi:hypothetical protein